MIIAENCGNHNGDMGLLKEMVYAASDSGASFSKIQSFFADDLNAEWGKDYDRIKSLELTWDQHAKFFEWCLDAKITPMTTVYTVKYAQRLSEIGFRWIKIGSPQCTNENLIRYYVTLGFNVVVSTGGTPIEKIPKVRGISALLHCVSKYPHQVHEANLMRMLDLKRYYGRNAEWYGFSDHSDPSFNTVEVSKAAIVLGADIIERHFTLLANDKTKDGPVSVGTQTLRELCNFYSDWRNQKENGLFQCDQSQDEIALIERYKTRWKSELLDWGLSATQ